MLPVLALYHLYACSTPVSAVSSSTALCLLCPSPYYRAHLALNACCASCCTAFICCTWTYRGFFLYHCVVCKHSFFLLCGLRRRAQLIKPAAARWPAIARNAPSLEGRNGVNLSTFHTYAPRKTPTRCRGIARSLAMLPLPCLLLPATAAHWRRLMRGRLIARRRFLRRYTGFASSSPSAGDRLNISGLQLLFSVSGTTIVRWRTK